MDDSLSCLGETAGAMKQNVNVRFPDSPGEVRKWSYIGVIKAVRNVALGLVGRIDYHRATRRGFDSAKEVLSVIESLLYVLGLEISS